MDLAMADQFVDGSAEPGGDGTEARPWRTIQDALERAGTDATIFVAAGVYDAPIRIRKGHGSVSLLGRCTDVVTVRAVDPVMTSTEEAYLVDIAGRDREQVTLSGFTLEGGQGGLILREGQAQLTDLVLAGQDEVGLTTMVGTRAELRGVTALEVAESGLVLNGDATLDTIRIAGGRPSNDEDSTFGMTISAGVTVEVAGSLTIEDQACVGISVSADATLSGTGVSITNVRNLNRCGFPAEAGPTGIVATYGAEVDLDGLDIQGATFGVFSLADAKVRLEGGRIHDLAGTTTVYASAAYCDLGGAFSWIDGEADHVEGVGFLFGRGEVGCSSATLERTTIRDVTGFRAETGESLGVGLLAANSAVTVSGVTFERVPIAAYVENGVTWRATRALLPVRFEGVDVTNAGSTEGSTGSIGQFQSGGLWFFGDLDLDLEDVEVAGSYDAGIVLSGVREASLLDVAVHGMKRSKYNTVAVGILAERTGGDIWERVRIHDIQGPGIVALNRSAVGCVDCSIRDVSFAAAVVEDSAFVLGESDVRGVTADATLGCGIGVVGLPGTDATTNAIALLEASIEDTDRAAVMLDGPGAYFIRGTTLVGPPPDGTQRLPNGQALLATGDIAPRRDGSGLGLEFLDSDLRSSGAPALVLDGASALLTGTTFTPGEPSILQQSCTPELEQPIVDSELAGMEVCPRYDMPVDRCSWTIGLAPPTL